MYYVAKALIEQLPTNIDPEKEIQEKARIKAVENLRRSRRIKSSAATGYGEETHTSDDSSRIRIEDLALDQYESQIAVEVVSPEDIPVGFEGLCYRESA